MSIELNEYTKDLTQTANTKTTSLSSNLLHNVGQSEDSDEAYTLDYGVKPIIKYVPKDKVIWSPFTTINGQFYKQLTENGNKVIVSHIKDGQDFLTYEPDEKWDMIIGNPPFKNKRLFFYSYHRRFT